MEKKNRDDERGSIRKINPNNSIIIGFSSSKNTICVKSEEILFRNQPAPKNLLLIGTEVKLLSQGNKPPRIEIDQNLDITALFGVISDIGRSQQILTINCVELSFEITFNQLIGPDRKPINILNCESLINTSVILYLSKDLPLEAKVINDHSTYSFRLDLFTIDSRGNRESAYVVMKDDRLIPHKIAKECVFYKNEITLFDIQKIEQCSGMEVKVFKRDSKIIGVVQIDSPSNQNYEIKNKLEHNRDSTCSLPSSYKSRASLNFNMPNHGQRTRTGTSTFFLKEYQDLDDRSVLLLSLFETCFRFPDWCGRDYLYHQITKNLPRDHLKILDDIFRQTRCNSIGQIENLYRIFRENIQNFEYCAKGIFSKPINFNLISHNFQIIIYLTDDSTSKWKLFKPLKVLNPIPIVYLKEGKRLAVVYTESLMQFDGYDPSTLEYKFPLNIDPGNFQSNNEENPNVNEIFEAAVKLQAKMSKNDSELCQLYYELVRSLRPLWKLENETGSSSLQNSYNELIKFSYENDAGKLQCICGKVVGFEYQCNDHYLCDRCAFISNSLNSCLSCGNQFQKESILNELTCSYCKYTNKSNYYFGMKCKCILCWNCLYHIVSYGYTMCYESHEFDEYSSSRIKSFLQGLGYSS